MSNLKEMCLVEGEVIYKTRVALLVPKEVAQDEERVKELLEERAQDDLGTADEVEYDNEVPVLVTTETGLKYMGSTIGNRVWKDIVEESARNKTALK